MLKSTATRWILHGDDSLPGSNPTALERPDDAALAERSRPIPAEPRWSATLRDSSAEEAAYMDTTTPPMLALDGVTILLPLRGRTEDGVYYDGARKVVPGDPRYDELLPLAQANPVPKPPANGRPVNPETRSMLRRAAGLE